MLAGRLPAPLGEFYSDLGRAEARHRELYLDLAVDAAAELGLGDWAARLAQLVAIEAQLVVQDDTQLRFHTGPPAALGQD